MNSKIKDFDSAFNKKIKDLPPEERARIVLKKLAQELEANKENIDEPQGLASGAMDENGKMITDFDEDYEDDQ